MSDEITIGKVAKWGFIGLLGVGALVVGISAVSIVTSPFRTAAGVVERTMDPNNVIATYERFHDRWRGYEARINQIRVTNRVMQEETNPSERNRLRIELFAQQQSCRDIVAGYNSDATKTNRSIFQGREAPEMLDPSRCEI